MRRNRDKNNYETSSKLIKSGDVTIRFLIFLQKRDEKTVINAAFGKKLPKKISEKTVGISRFFGDLQKNSKKVMKNH